MIGAGAGRETGGSREGSCSVDAGGRMPPVQGKGDRVIAHPAAFLSMAALSFGANVGLGRLRAASRKFSRAWFVWVHLSVPFIIALRIHFGLRPLILVIPTLFACAVAGQMAGGRLYASRRAAG